MKVWMLSATSTLFAREVDRLVLEVVVAIDEDARGLVRDDFFQGVLREIREGKMEGALHVNFPELVSTPGIKNNGARFAGHLDELVLGHPVRLADRLELFSEFYKAAVIHGRVLDFSSSEMDD